MMHLKHFSLRWLLLFVVILASCIPEKFGPGTGYEIREDKVYYSEYEGGYQRSHSAELIPEAEARTFHILDQFEYAKDAHHVYYKGKAIENAEAAIFEILGCGYARDSQYVYFYGKIFEGAQVASFKVIGSCYALDDQHVYIGGDVIENAQPDSFEFLPPSGPHTGIYARDDQHVYRMGIVMENAQPDSFEVLGYTGTDCHSQGEYYTRDKQSVYFSGEVIPGADPETFQMLRGCGYAKDAKRAYFESRVVAGADLTTFRILGNSQARDKNNCYRYGFVISVEECN